MSERGRTLLHGSATREAWDFARVEEFWARFSPLSPYARDAKDERPVLSERPAIEDLYDATEAALSLIGRSPGPALDRVAYHLRRLPRIPLASLAEPGRNLELVELFQVKKFLSNYRSILALLDEPARRFFGLEFRSAELAARLDLGGSDPETFFVAEAYHESLPAIRREIEETDASLAALRGGATALLRDRLGIDFAGRDFIIVPHDEARGLLSACSESDREAPLPGLAVEAYDGASCIVRLQEGAAALELEERRSRLESEEREVESAVLLSLSAAVIAELPRLGDYINAICDFDLALARARLCREYGLVRPRLDSDSLRVRSGRFLPCAWDCRELGLAYTPLDLDLPEPAAVLFGSNMGGKTVALQSLVFFQILAQSGHFVPAEQFESRVHRRIVYVGELDAGRGRDASKGLSGFGFEIRSFVEAVSGCAAGGGAGRVADAALRQDGESGSEAEGIFAALDEFARTTASHEAEAMLSAALELLAVRKGSRSLFATHFHGVERVAGVRFLRMRGLDRGAAGMALDSAEPLAERIRRINGMMRYEIVEERGDEESESDALAIASLLGLDPDIVGRAEYFYRQAAARRARGE
ncbi:MAG TPA: hypothetical protein VMC79_08095 [Rectinemataceae bacterium]|nr:hypothetical protein [Rectinemataceae bacterium]